MGTIARKSKYIGLVTAGQTFGNWTVIDDTPIVGDNKNYKNITVKVRCVCGLEKYSQVAHLIKGYTKGCRKCRKHPSGPFAANWKGIGEIPLVIYYRIKYGASKREISFDVSIQYLAQLFKKQNGKCALTGRTIKFGSGFKRGKETTASLDRIDSSKGYVKGNLQWTHKDVNRAKMALSTSEFIQLCEEVISYGSRKIQS